MFANEDERRRGQAISDVASKPRLQLPWWLAMVVGTGALLALAGGIIALLRPEMLVSPHDQINGAVHIYAGYLFSRNLVLGILLLAALGLRARGMLGNLMLFTGLVQLCDACVDSVEGRWPIVPVVLILGVVFLIGSARITGYPFWKIGAWRQTDPKPIDLHR